MCIRIQGLGEHGRRVPEPELESLESRRICCRESNKLVVLCGSSTGAIAQLTRLDYLMECAMQGSSKHPASIVLHEVVRYFHVGQW